MRTPAGAVTRLPPLAGGAAVALVALALPRVTGARWHDIEGALSRPTPAQLAVLGVLWLVGLCVHTPALTAALPGLSHRRALLLNLSGSFVSNLLPLGGAAGTVVNWRMARTWGRFRRVQPLGRRHQPRRHPRQARPPGARPVLVRARLDRTAADDRHRGGGRRRPARGHGAGGRARGSRRPAAASRRVGGPTGLRRGCAPSHRTRGLRRAGGPLPLGSAVLVRDGWGRMLGGKPGTRRCRRCCCGRACGWSAARSHPSSSRPRSWSSACSPWSS